MCILRISPHHLHYTNYSVASQAGTLADQLGHLWVQAQVPDTFGGF